MQAALFEAVSRARGVDWQLGGLSWARRSGWRFAVSVSHRSDAYQHLSAPGSLEVSLATDRRICAAHEPISGRRSRYGTSRRSQTAFSLYARAARNFNSGHRGRKPRRATGIPLAEVQGSAPYHSAYSPAVPPRLDRGPDSCINGRAQPVLATAAVKFRVECHQCQRRCSVPSVVVRPGRDRTHREHRG